MAATTRDPRDTLVTHRTDWFTDARFGMFIHWGLYALGARHEWVQQIEQTPAERYAARYFDRFDPDLYDPEAWADAAAGAGMKYTVVTSKHHEGFCLFDSALTDFKATNTPAGRDLLAPMLDAFRSRGMRTGLYYSLLDWHHPDFTVDSLHPLRKRPDRAALNEGRDMDRYRAYLHGQVRELLTDYGDIDILWADFSYASGGHADALGAGGDGKGRADWDSETLVRMIREIRPDILLNDRLDWPEEADITTPEQFMPEAWPERDGKKLTWEMCHTFSGSWGYFRDEQSWKSPAQLISLLAEAVSKGGNLLLNVGPTGRGEFDERALERLRAIGAWMRRHSRSIYGCTQLPDDLRSGVPAGVTATYNPSTNRAYLHLVEYPTQPVLLKGWGPRLAYAQMLHDASEVVRSRRSFAASQYGMGGDDIAVAAPGIRPDVEVPVIELFLT